MLKYLYRKYLFFNCPISTDRAVRSRRYMHTTFYFRIGYEYKIKSAKSITYDRLFNERFLIDLATKMIHTLDIHPNHKIHYIAISVSNFSNRANYKTYSLLSLKRDTKFAALSSGLNKIRDKYGVDMIKYARENMVVPPCATLYL